MDINDMKEELKQIKTSLIMLNVVKESTDKQMKDLVERNNLLYDEIESIENPWEYPKTLLVCNNMDAPQLRVYPFSTNLNRYHSKGYFLLGISNETPKQFKYQARPSSKWSTKVRVKKLDLEKYNEDLLSYYFNTEEL